MDLMPHQLARLLAVTCVTVNRLEKSDPFFPRKSPQTAGYSVSAVLDWLHTRSQRSSPCGVGIPISVDLDQLIPPPVAAKLAGCSADTLSAYRQKCAKGESVGPPFIVLKHRLVRYEATSLARWAEERRPSPRKKSFTEETSLHELAEAPPAPASPPNQVEPDPPEVRLGVIREWPMARTSYNGYPVFWAPGKPKRPIYNTIVWASREFGFDLDFQDIEGWFERIGTQEVGKLLIPCLEAQIEEPGAPQFLIKHNDVLHEYWLAARCMLPNPDSLTYKRFMEENAYEFEGDSWDEILRKIVLAVAEVRMPHEMARGEIEKTDGSGVPDEICLD